VLTRFLRARLGALWDVFWRGGMTDAVMVMQQIGYLLFLHRLEASDKRRQAQAELCGRPYTSVFIGHDECRWSHFIQLPPAEMFVHLDDCVFPFVRQLAERGRLCSYYMRQAVFAIPSASMLAEAVAIIDDVYTSIDREQAERTHEFHDTHGDMYDFLLSEISAAGKTGRFRTPRHIIRLVCAMVDPQLEDRICDPACGSGGFLIGAYHHILTRHTSPEHRRRDRYGIEYGLLGDQLTDELQWEVLREKTFHGFDFDSEIARVGLMNLILHGIGDASLDSREGGRPHQRFDVVLANPPFVSEVYDDALYDEAGGGGRHEALFVRQVFELLRVGGRAGVVVPLSVLTGDSLMHLEVRRMLIEETDLQGIVSLPAGMFQPWSDVAAAILVFVRGGQSDHVWFCTILSNGQVPEHAGGTAWEPDIPDIIRRWRERDPEQDTNHSGRAFFVPAAEIRRHDYVLAMDAYRSGRPSGR